MIRDSILSTTTNWSRFVASSPFSVFSVMSVTFIFIFKITNCDLKRIVTYYCMQRQCFYPLSHNCTTPFFERNVKSIVLLR